MRLNVKTVNAHLIYELQKADVIRSIAHNAFDIVLVELHTGEQVAFHLIERDIDVAYIKEILEYNARAGRYTLFMLWCPMLLPDDGMLYPPYDWMSTLLALYGDKIYAFESEGPHCWFFPVYFERQTRGLERLVRWGHTIDMGGLHTDIRHTEGSFINGRWQIGDFDPPANADETPRRRAHASLRVYYEVLGLALDADWETIKRAYRSLAMQFHPDLNAAPEANERMQNINAAYAKIATQFEGASG